MQNQSHIHKLWSLHYNLPQKHNTQIIINASSLCYIDNNIKQVNLGDVAYNSSTHLENSVSPPTEFIIYYYDKDKNKKNQNDISIQSQSLQTKNSIIIVPPECCWIITKKP